MKILILSLNDVTTPLIYPEGPLYVAKQIEEGCELKLLSAEFYSTEELKIEIKKFQADLVMCSIRNIMNFTEKTKNIIDFLKKNRIKFIVGGPAISVFKTHAQTFLEIDHKNLFIGEFESQIAKIFPGLKNINDVDKIKMPDGSFLKYSDNNLYNPERIFGIECKRGCAYNCIYCSYPFLSGNKYRTRKPEVVVENLKKLIKIGIKKFFFSDSIFNIPNDYSYNLCQMIVKEKIKAEFGAFINPLDISEKEAKLWQKINLNAELGVDGLSDKSLLAWNKPFNLGDVKKAIDILKKYNVNFNLYLMFNAPGQTMEDVKKEIETLEKLNPPIVEITMNPTVYPITKLYKQAIADHVIKENELLIPAKTYYSPLINQGELNLYFKNKIAQYQEKKWGVIFNQYTSNPTLDRYSRATHLL